MIPLTVSLLVDLLYTESTTMGYPGPVSPYRHKPVSKTSFTWFTFEKRDQDNAGEKLTKARGCPEMGVVWNHWPSNHHSDHTTNHMNSYLLYDIQWQIIKRHREEIPGLKTDVRCSVAKDTPLATTPKQTPWTIMPLNHTTLIITIRLTMLTFPSVKARDHGYWWHWVGSKEDANW